MGFRFVSFIGLITVTLLALSWGSALDVDGAPSGELGDAPTGVELIGEITKFKLKQRKDGDYKIIAKLTLRNDGTEIVRGPISVSLFLSDDATLDSEDELLDTRILTADLLPGETSDVIKLKGTGLPLVSGFGIVTFDDDNVVDERDEDNTLVEAILPPVLQFAVTENADVPFVAVQENGAVILLERDAIQERNNAFSFIASDGGRLTLWFGREGFPTRAVVADHMFLFANYSPTTVDIAIIDPDGNSQLFLDTPLGSELQAFVAEFANGPTTTRSLLTTSMDSINGLTREDFLPPSEDPNFLPQFKKFRKIVGLLFSLNPLKQVPALFQKGQSVLDVIAKLEKNLAVDMAKDESESAVFKVLTNTALCAGFFDIGSCVDLGLGLFQSAAELGATLGKIEVLEELLRRKQELQERSPSFSETFNPSDTEDPFNQHQPFESPIADFSIAPSTRLTSDGDGDVFLSGSPSFAIGPDNFIREWRWEMRIPNDEGLQPFLIGCCGDNAFSGSNVIEGTYVVILTVTDNNGLQGIRKKTFEVIPPSRLPFVTLEFPPGDSPIILEPSTPPTEIKRFTAIRARLSEPTDKDVVVTLVYSGTATQGSDYQINPGSGLDANTLRIPAGAVLGDEIGFLIIEALPDSLEEGDEFIQIDIEDVVNAVEDGTQQLSVVIVEQETLQPPIASFTITQITSTAPFDILLDASESFDPNGAIVTYEWSNTGSSSVLATGQTITLVTSLTGPFSITLTVTDDDGLTASITQTGTAVGTGGTGGDDSSIVGTWAIPSANQNPAARLIFLSDGTGSIRTWATTFPQVDGIFARFNYTFSNGELSLNYIQSSVVSCDFFQGAWMATPGALPDFSLNVDPSAGTMNINGAIYQRDTGSNGNPLAGLSCTSLS